MNDLVNSSVDVERKRTVDTYVTLLDGVERIESGWYTCTRRFIPTRLDLLHLNTHNPLKFTTSFRKRDTR